MESQNCTFLSFSLFIYFVLFWVLISLFVGGRVQKWAKPEIHTYVIAMPLLMVLAVCVCMCDFISAVVLYIYVCHITWHFLCCSLSLCVFYIERIEFMVLVLWFLFAFLLLLLLLLWLTKGTAHNLLKDCCTKFFDTIIHWFQLSLLSRHVCVCVCVCLFVCDGLTSWNSNGTTNLAYAQFIVSLNFATKLKSLSLPSSSSSQPSSYETMANR